MQKQENPLKTMMEERIVIKYQKTAYEELPTTEQHLIECARQVTNKSYSPYSHFSVGAAILLANDIIITGSNQENAAYPSGICAERTALFYANSQYPDQPVKMMAIAAKSKEGYTQIPITPCGACRQVIMETEKRFGHPIKILLYGEKETIIIEGVKDLLPFSFDNDYL